MFLTLLRIQFPLIHRFALLRILLIVLRLTGLRSKTRR